MSFLMKYPWLLISQERKKRAYISIFVVVVVLKKNLKKNHNFYWINNYDKIQDFLLRKGKKISTQVFFNLKCQQFRKLDFIFSIKVNIVGVYKKMREWELFLLISDSIIFFIFGNPRHNEEKNLPPPFLPFKAIRFLLCIQTVFGILNCATLNVFCVCVRVYLRFAHYAKFAEWWFFPNSYNNI